MKTIYRKVEVEEQLPELNKFVPCVDTAGEIIIYRRVENTPPKAIGLQWAWNMRDGVGTNSPNNNLPITHWLEEVNLTEEVLNGLFKKQMEEGTSGVGTPLRSHLRSGFDMGVWALTGE